MRLPKDWQPKSASAYQWRVVVVEIAQFAVSRRMSALWRRSCGHRSCLPDRDLALDIVGFEADCLGRPHARQDRDVVEFLDRVLEAQPFDDVAGVDVDDQQAAACDSVLFGQALVERQPGKGLAVARPRQADDGVAADEGEAPRIAGTKADRRKRAVGRIDGAEFAGAGIQQPKPARRRAAANAASKSRWRRSRRWPRRSRCRRRAAGRASRRRRRSGSPR